MNNRAGGGGGGGRANVLHTMELYPLYMAPSSTFPGPAASSGRDGGGGVARLDLRGPSVHSLRGTASTAATLPPAAAQTTTTAASAAAACTCPGRSRAPRGNTTGGVSANSTRVEDRAAAVLGAHLRELLLDRLQAKRRDMAFAEYLRSPQPSPTPTPSAAAAGGGGGNGWVPVGSALPPPRPTAMEAYFVALEECEAAARPSFDPLQGRRLAGSTVTRAPVADDDAPDFTSAVQVVPASSVLGGFSSLVQRRLKDAQSSPPPPPDDTVEEPGGDRVGSSRGLEDLCPQSRVLVRPQRRRRAREEEGTEREKEGEGAEAESAHPDPFRVHRLKGLPQHDRTIMAWTGPYAYTAPGGMVVGGTAGKRVRPGAWERLHDKKHHADPSAGGGGGSGSGWDGDDHGASGSGAGERKKQKRKPKYVVGADGELVRVPGGEGSDRDDSDGSGSEGARDDDDLLGAVNDAIKKKGYGKDLSAEERRKADEMLQEQRTKAKKKGKKSGNKDAKDDGNVAGSGGSKKGKKTKTGGGEQGAKPGTANSDSSSVFGDVSGAMGYPIGGVVAVGPGGSDGDVQSSYDRGSHKHSFDYTLTNEELEEIRQKYAEAGGDGSPLSVPSRKGGPGSPSAGRHNVPGGDGGDGGLSGSPLGGSLGPTGSAGVGGGSGGGGPGSPMLGSTLGGSPKSATSERDRVKHSHGNGSVGGGGGIFNTDWSDFVNQINEDGGEDGDGAGRRGGAKEELSSGELARRIEAMEAVEEVDAAEALRQGLEADEKNLDELLKQFPDAGKHVRLRKQVNGILADLAFGDDEDDFGWFKLPAFDIFRSPRAGEGGTGASGGTAGGEEPTEEEVLAGFAINEEELRKKYRKEVLEAELRDLVAQRGKLRGEVSDQLVLLNSFKNDVRFLSSGDPSKKLSGEQYAVQLTREVSAFARQYNLILSDAFSAAKPGEVRVESVAEGFLNRFSKGRALTRDVGSQVDDKELGYVDDGVREAEEQMEDFFLHEKCLLSAIKMAAIAMANLMSFHASLELESTCKECFYIFEQPRTLWPCGHTFCQQCLSGMHNKHDELICAECGSLCEVGYTPNLSMELIANYQIVQDEGTSGGGRVPSNGRGETLEGVLRALLKDLLMAQKAYVAPQSKQKSSRKSVEPS